MRRSVSILAVLLAMSLLPALVVARTQDRDDTKPAAKAKAKDQDKDKDKDRDDRSPKAKIVKGPVIEYVGPDSAVVAWTTNVKASTILRYGTNPGDLNHKAEEPWGGTNHRVHLKELKPNTTYYFDVESQHAQGTGSQAESAKLSFKTPAKNGAREHYPKPGPGF